MTPDFTAKCSVNDGDELRLYGRSNGSVGIRITIGEFDSESMVVLTPGDVIRLSRALKQLVERRWQ